MSHDDFAFEPQPGLPAPLPDGETLLWQGTPDWQALAIQAYHVRKIAGYFLLLIVWRLAAGFRDGHSASAMLTSCAILAGLGALAIGMLSLLAYFNARSTIYSITNRRVLLRHGVAVPLTMNVPFGLIETASLKSFANGTGDIAVTVARGERVGYLVSWPHVRPGRFARPEPSFRALSDAPHAAQLLASALAADSGCDPKRLDLRQTGSQPAGLRQLDPRSGSAAAA